MDDVLPMQPSSFEETFATSAQRTNRPPSPSSPFTFDLRISDFSASQGNNMSMSFSMSGTPAYSDTANPFFQSGFDDKKAVSALQPAFMTEQETKEGILDLNESQRKRALQRLSLASSVASSAGSTAPSEAEDDREWESFAGPQRNSCDMYRKDSQMERAYVGLSHAFSQQQLAGPCSFNGGEGEANELSHARSQATLCPDLQAPAAIDPRGQDAGVFPNFNLEDFIADAEHQGEGAVGHHQVSASESAPDSFATFATSHPHFEQRQMPPELLTQLPELGNNLFSVTSAQAQAGEPAHLAALPMTPQSSTSYSDIDRPGSAVSNSSHGSSAADNEHLRFPSQARSLSFSGQATPSLSMQSDASVSLAGSMADRGAPVHASLLRVRKPETPVRSSSTPNIHDTLSCNPAHITPASAAEGPFDGGAPNFAPYLASNAAQNLFGRFDIPDSPTSSAMSSPPHWAPGLHNEDPGEETYRQSHYSAANHLSSSLPVRPTLLRAQTSALSMPPSPTSGIAGQPMRPTRSTAAGQPSPYDSPASHGVAAIRHHVLPPTHPLAHLQNPYSGVITKRSRGRRVPNTPEEMTNVGKSGKVYTCKVPGCGKLFKRSEHLKRHIRSIHTDEKPYQCQVCHKRFSRHDNLNQHMRVHGSGGAGADSAASSADDSPASSPLHTSSRGSSRSQSFAETRGGTITRRNFKAGVFEDGVFDFDDGVEDGDVKLLSL